MKIAMIINGTRGDVQPMVSLAAGLIQRGHEVTICCPPENEMLVKKFQCRFISFGPDYREMFRQQAHKIKGGANASPSPKQIKEDTAQQIQLLPAIINDAELVLGVGFVLGVHTVADILGVPYRFVIFYPSIMGTSSEDKFIYRLLFGFGKSMTNMVMKGFINNKRKDAGLRPISDVWKHWMGDEVIVACDREINAVKPGVGYRFVQTGFMMLPAREGVLPDHVIKFLDKGKPPVFIGFGSNPVANPDKYQDLFAAVAKSTNQRLIISKGWAGLDADNNEDILYIDEISYELLFPRLSAIIYHGGTGTMAIAARAGIPQAAFPFMADQFENRKQILKLGIGPQTCDFKKMTSESLSAAIISCISNQSYKVKAQELAAKLDSEGTTATVRLVEDIVTSKK